VCDNLATYSVSNSSSSLLPSSCKIFASAGAGFDWVDTKTMAEKGIIYCNSAAACTESAADAAIYMLLGTFRGFTRSSLAARSLDPAQFQDATSNLPGLTHNPAGNVLGIVGLGRIGVRIADKAHAAFGMRIAYHDVVRAPAATEARVGAEFRESLEDLLCESDCVVLTVPYTGKVVMEARHFQAMKKGGRFVNVARGKLVDEAGLVAALRSGHLSAAGLDVHADEPHVNPELAIMPNVEVHCHTAGGSVESHIGFERLGMENIMAYFKTGNPISPVNLHLISQQRQQ
jgi:lactate dehydrogenase-like 2-hydroxyacid dehydrogenase